MLRYETIVSNLETPFVSRHHNSRVLALMFRTSETRMPVHMFSLAWLQTREGKLDYLLRFSSMDLDLSDRLCLWSSGILDPLNSSVYFASINMQIKLKT